MSYVSTCHSIKTVNISSSMKSPAVFWIRNEATYNWCALAFIKVTKWTFPQLCKAPQESTAAWLFAPLRLSSSFGKVKADMSRLPIENQHVMQVMEDAWTDNSGWGHCCKFGPFRLMLSIPAAEKWQKINHEWRAEILARKEQIYDGSYCFQKTFSTSSSKTPHLSGRNIRVWKQLKA